MKRILFYVLCILMIFCTSCSKDAHEEIVYVSSPSTKTITYITSPKALNTRGYASMIAEALMRSENLNGFTLKMIVPDDLNDGISWTERMLQKYYNCSANDSTSIANYKSSCQKNLLLIGDELYRDAILRFDSISNAPDKDYWQSVLMFETRKDSVPCKTFNIERYGAMYISGHIATNFAKRIFLITAYEDNDNLASAIEGFRDGLTDSQFKYDFKVNYLAENSQGFNMPNEAKSKCVEYGNMSKMVPVFVMPLAGASNEGIYECSREYENFYTAGMDYDVHVKSDEIAFNVLIHTDSLIIKYVDAFLADSLAYMDMHPRYGLSSGYIEVVPVPYYGEACQEWIDYLMPAAMKKEEKYLKDYREI